MDKKDFIRFLFGLDYEYPRQWYFVGIDGGNFYVYEYEPKSDQTLEEFAKQEGYGKYFLFYGAAFKRLFYKLKADELPVDGCGDLGALLVEFTGDLAKAVARHTITHPDDTIENYGC